MLCPCHQSTFDLADNSRVLFGPAARPLPQLPLGLDDEGYLIAMSDFLEPVGPSYWERGCRAMSSAATASPESANNAPGGPVKWLDDRIGLYGLAKKQLRKVFPDHWSFMLGEIALWSFVVLLLTGVFLSLWFKPSMAEVEYMGSYANLRGIHMSEAYSSTLELSFDVRGGLLDAADAPLGRLAVSRRDDRSTCSGCSSRGHSGSHASSTG